MAVDTGDKRRAPAAIILTHFARKTQGSNYKGWLWSKPRYLMLWKSMQQRHKSFYILWHLFIFHNYRQISNKTPKGDAPTTSEWSTFYCLLRYGLYSRFGGRPIMAFLHDRPWISPWIKSISNELDVICHVFASYCLVIVTSSPIDCDVISKTRVLFWCLFPSLLRNSGNKHQNNPLVSA